jgi:hypothetical protein
MRAIAAMVLLFLSGSSAAEAQRFNFDRTFEVGAAPAVEVSTDRGTITVTAGAPGRVVVRGTVTVRAGVDVPADAVAIAQRVAADPPVTHSGDLVRLAVPADRRVHRAVTVSYVVEAPPASRVTTVSQSGETNVSGIAGAVSVRTQSAAIAIADLGGSAEVRTGSGAVQADGVAGALRVTTSSSSITASGLRGALHGRTQSGAVAATMDGGGPIDIRTGSSGVRLRGVAGETTVETGSGRVEVWLAAPAHITLDATTRSGSVDVRDLQVDGSVEKRHVVGTIGGGGAQVRLVTRSGSIRVTP